MTNTKKINEERRCAIHNSPGCENCFDGSTEEPPSDDEIKEKTKLDECDIKGIDAKNITTRVIDSARLKELLDLDEGKRMRNVPEEIQDQHNDFSKDGLV